MNHIINAIKAYIEKKRKEKKRKKIIKQIKRFFRKMTKRENLAKILVIISTLAILGSSILPYLLR